MASPTKHYSPFSKPSKYEHSEKSTSNSKNSPFSKPSKYEHSEKSTFSSEKSTPKYSAEQLKEKIRQREEQVKEMIRLLKLSQEVDLAFLVDCTGSMQPHMNGVKEMIGSLGKKLGRDFPYLQLRLGFVRYTDFDMGANKYSTLGWTSDISEFSKFVASLKAQGGGDGPEDVFFWGS